MIGVQAKTAKSPVASSARLEQSGTSIDRSSDHRSTDQGSRGWVNHAGNFALQSLARAGTLHPKPAIGGRDDPEEREADRIADAVMRGERVSPVASVRPACGGQGPCTSCPAAPGVRPSSTDGGAGLGADDAARAVTALRDGGEPIRASERALFEPAFGSSLVDVRIHTHSDAARSARSIGARAYAIGSNVGFAAGEYAPGAESGRRLLAHELAHVVQARPLAVVRRQDTGVASPIPPTGEVSADEPPSTPRISRIAPWAYTGGGDQAGASLALYGVDLSTADDFDPPVEGLLGAMLGGDARVIAYPDLLLQPYRDEFHSGMRRCLDQDVSSIEDMLLQTYVGGEDEAALMRQVHWWSQWRDLRVQGGGRTYFDEFLGRLAADHLVTSYGLWESNRRSYLDELYDAVEERVGELNTVIAQGSQEFGAYRPIWAELERRAGTPGARHGVNVELVERSANVVLDALEGWTTESDSAIIADLMTGLPPQEQVAVLRRIMSRYDESDWTGIFGRFGEAWEGGMLYWLFEDLDESDRNRVSESLVRGGVLEAAQAHALVAGRGWGGRWLPFTTYYGAQAAQYWANVAVENEGTAAGYAAWAPGLLASLWTPETAGSTVLTLGTAGVAPGIAEAFPTVGRGMLVIGTGVTAYGTTLAVEELITGRDAYTGVLLDDTDRLVRVLQVVSGALLLAGGFLQAAALTPPRGGAPGGLGEGPVTPGSGVRFRVIRVAGDEYTVIGENLETGELALVRLNARTGMGTATHMGTGETLPISGFQLEGAPAGLLPSGGAPATIGAPLAPSTAIVPGGAPVAAGPRVGPPLLRPGAAPGTTETGDLLSTLGMSFDVEAGRLDTVIRSGPFPPDTRAIAAAIIEIDGYAGSTELRAISGAATDDLVVGASIEHALTPSAREISSARSIGGAYTRGEFPFSHINDAEIKLLHHIRSRLPPNPRGRIHILSYRSRGGGAIIEPIAVCSSCIHGMWQQVGDFPNVDIVIHSATVPAPTIDLGPSTSEGP